MPETFNLEKELYELAESQDVLKSISDIDYAKHVIDGICEATGLPRWQVMLGYKAVAPLMCCTAEGASKLLGDATKQKMLSVASRIPWAKTVIKAIKDRTTKTTQEIEATKAAKAYLSERRTEEQAALEFRKDISLEFNALLDVYDKQHRLGEELKILGESLDRIREDLCEIESHANPQPRFKQVLNPDPRHRFVYRSNYIPFVGRKDYLERLNTFLWSDAYFSWQAITAPGGAGKSRLAWEFCRRNAIVWRAGFLDGLTDEKFSFRSWQPKQPTLLVLDYASKDRDSIKTMLTILAERANPDDPGLDCAVRVLLLDRDNQDDWLRNAWPGSGGHAVEQYQHDEPWSLEPSLGDNALEGILHFFLEGKSDSSTEAIQKHLEALREIDPKMRPLFAAFYADAVAREGIGRRWDIESLIRDVILREKNLYWHREGDCFVTAKDEALLALATMMGGVSTTDDKLPPQVTSFDELIEHSDRFEALGCYSEVGNDEEVILTVPAWEPDLVGELFVLDLLKDNRITKSNSCRKILIHSAWEMKPAGAMSFFNRLVQDYPDHPNLRNMLTPPTNTDRQKLWLIIGINMCRWTKSPEYLSNVEIVHKFSRDIFSADKSNKFAAITYSKILSDYIAISATEYSEDIAASRLNNFDIVGLNHNSFPEAATYHAESLQKIINLYIANNSIHGIAKTYNELKLLWTHYINNKQIAYIASSTILSIFRFLHSDIDHQTEHDLFEDTNVLFLSTSQDERITTDKAMIATILIEVRLKFNDINNAEIHYKSIKAALTFHPNSNVIALELAKSILVLVNHHMRTGYVYAAEQLRSESKRLLAPFTTNQHITSILAEIAESLTPRHHNQNKFAPTQ